MEGGEAGLDDDRAATANVNIGAIMGRNVFGPVRGPWGEDQTQERA